MDDAVIFHCIGIRADGSRCTETIVFKLEYVVEYAREHPERLLQYTCLNCNRWLVDTVDECTVTNLHLQHEE